MNAHRIVLLSVVIAFAVVARPSSADDQDSIPEHVDKMVREFEHRTRAIREKAKRELQAERTKLLAKMRIVESVAKELGWVKTAAKVRSRIQEVERKSASGLDLASGIYHARLTVGGSTVETRKLILTR